MNKKQALALIEEINSQAYHSDPHLTMRGLKLGIKRVNAGMKALDKEKPDWIEDVAINKLNMGDGYYCICGQVFGEFGNDACRAFFGIPQAWKAFDNKARQLGFCASNLVPWELLDILWVNALSLRARTGQKRFLKVPS